MPQRDLYVFARVARDFVPAGRLTLTETDREVQASTFAYGTRYRQRAGRFEVDPVSLDIRDPGAAQDVERFPIHGLAQFGGIRDAAPDAWGRRVIEARHRVPANSLPESTYLLEAGSDRVGALDVRADLRGTEHPGVSPLRTLDDLLEAAERIEAGEEVPARLTDLFGSGPGAGGARPKATVRDEQGLLWLAKFPRRSDVFDVATAEWATLRLAARCGLSVPSVRVIDLAGQSVLLVRRFDRYWAHPDGPIPPDAALHESLPADTLVEFRLPFVSGLTLVACDERESPTKSYADLAAAIRERAHVSVIRNDNRELFARMVFNILVSNDDDHLRNHAFIRDPRLSGWRLSPLYDVVPRPSRAYGRFLHLGVGPQGRAATLDNALGSRAAFALERPDAIATMARLWREVAGWRACFEELGVSGRLLDRLGPAFRDLADVASDGLRNEIALALIG